MTAAGLVGVFGQAVASRAMQGHKEDHGAARIHDLEMAGNLVQERRMNNACVTRTHAQVRKKKILIFLLCEKSLMWFNNVILLYVLRFRRNAAVIAWVQALSKGVWGEGVQKKKKIGERSEPFSAKLRIPLSARPARPTPHSASSR